MKSSKEDGGKNETNYNLLLFFYIFCCLSHQIYCNTIIYYIKNSNTMIFNFYKYTFLFYFKYNKHKLVHDKYNFFSMLQFIY